MAGKAEASARKLLTWGEGTFIKRGLSGGQ